MQKSIPVILGLMILFFAISCDKNTLKTYPVTGKVTYKGEPVAGASVSFIPKVEGQGDNGFARTDDNGNYKLQTQLGKPEGGTTPGEYIIRVSKTDLVPTGRKTVESTGTVSEEMTPVSVLPAKYDSNANTPLSFTVEKKKNTYDIVIED